MLTDVECRKAVAREKPYKMIDSSGLYLEVTSKGYKYWRLKYYYDKKEKRLSLGVYPNVSLSVARSKRDDVKSSSGNGIDPSLQRKKQKELFSYIIRQTFEAVATEWHGRKTNWSARYGDIVMRRMQLDLFPLIGGYPIAQLTPPLVMNCIQEIETRHAHEMARRFLGYVRDILRYAVATGRAERDFTPDIKGVLKLYHKKTMLRAK